jgi:hypothetical protein
MHSVQLGEFHNFCIEASSFLTLLLQPNNETAESITPLLSVVPVGSLPCLEVLIEVHDQLDE